MVKLNIQISWNRLAKIGSWYQELFLSFNNILIYILVLFENIIYGIIGLGGYMGNIDFAENARLGHFDPGTLSQDKDYFARDPHKLYLSMRNLNTLLSEEIDRINRV